MTIKALKSLTFLLSVSLLIAGCSSLYFFPKKNMIRQANDWNVQAQEVHFKSSDDIALHGWYLPAKTAKTKAKATVFFLHGNSLNISYYFENIKWLSYYGINVFMFDYRGFGQSEGKATLPEIYQDIDAAYAWLKDFQVQQDSSHTPTFVLGQSIGGALGSYWLGKNKHLNQDFSGFIVDCSFASFNDMTQHVAASAWLLWPFQYPVRWSFSNDYNPINYSHQIALPILQFHSRDDSVVPYVEGEKLFKSFHSQNRDSETKKEWVATEGIHIATFDQQKNRDKLLEFINSNL